MVFLFLVLLKGAWMQKVGLKVKSAYSFVGRRNRLIRKLTNFFIT